MYKPFVEKDGWHVVFNDGKCGWVESNPTYTKICPTCKGNGYYYVNSCPDCKDQYYGLGKSGCDHMRSCHCKNGFTMDNPKHPMPSIAILDKLALKLQQTMKEFGLRLDSGIIEQEIIEEKAKADSLNGACL
jgi:hypothetical protein